MLLRKTKKENLLIPNMSQHKGGDDVGYEGNLCIYMIYTYVGTTIFYPSKT